MIDPQPTREAIARATHTAMLATTGFIGEQRQQLQACTPATRDALLVQFALTHLASYGLISIADAEQFEGWLPLELEPPFADDMLAAVREGVENQARINAALR